MNNNTRTQMLLGLRELVDEMGGIPEEVAREQKEEWVELTRSLGYEPDDRALGDATLVVAQQIMGILLVQETMAPKDPTIGCLKALLYVLATTAFTDKMEGEQ